MNKDKKTDRYGQESIGGKKMLFSWKKSHQDFWLFFWILIVSSWCSQWSIIIMKVNIIVDYCQWRNNNNNVLHEEIWKCKNWTITLIWSRRRLWWKRRIRDHLLGEDVDNDDTGTLDWRVIDIYYIHNDGEIYVCCVATGNQIWWMISLL